MEVLACVAGVQRGGREEVECEREARSLGARWRSVPYKRPTIALRARIPPSLPFVHRPRRLWRYMGGRHRQKYKLRKQHRIKYNGLGVRFKRYRRCRNDEVKMQLDKCSVVEWKTPPMNGFDIVNIV